MRWSFVVMLPLLAILVHCSDPPFGGDKGKAEPKDDKKPYLLVVPPTGGKEVKLVDWRFLLGTRRFALLDEPPINPKTKMPTGPEYLEFREDKSTTFQNGILTLVPIASLRKIDYDREKKTVTVVAVKAGDKEETLTGTTKFIGINKITIEADAILEGLGAASVKFQGGVDKDLGLRNITFPPAEAPPAVKGAAWSIVAADKEKTKHVAHDLQPLYFIDGGYRVLPYVSFKTTVKIDMDKIAALRFIPSHDKKKISYDYEVTLKDGVKHMLTMLTKIELEKKKTASFEGLLGRVPVGYKLFPSHTIQELRAAEDEKK